VINSSVVVRADIARSSDRPPRHLCVICLEWLAEPPSRLADSVGQRQPGGLGAEVEEVLYEKSVSLGNLAACLWVMPSQTATASCLT
jgi:hypothetical protein